MSDCKCRKGNASEQRPPIMDFFAYGHLPAHLALVSKVFCDAAEEVLERTYPGAEQSTALRKLLEAKDAAVRAALHPKRGDK